MKTKTFRSNPLKLLKMIQKMFRLLGIRTEKQCDKNEVHAYLESLRIEMD